MSFEDNPADNENYERDLAHEEIRQLTEEIKKLRKILSFVPGRIAVEAKERAGYPTHIIPLETMP